MAEKGAKDRLCSSKVRGRISQGAKEPGGESSRRQNGKGAKKPDTSVEQPARRHAVIHIAACVLMLIEAGGAQALIVPRTEDTTCD